MLNFEAVVYNDTRKQFTLNFPAATGKDAVKHLRDVTQDDAVYFKLNQLPAPEHVKCLI